MEKSSLLTISMIQTEHWKPKEFEEPTVVAVKHANPCGVGTGFDIYSAYVKTYNADPVSIYGGIIAANRTIDEITANEISKIFVEIVIAPDFTEEALAILTKKKIFA